MTKSQKILIEVLVAVAFACFLSTNLLVRHSTENAFTLPLYLNRVLEITVCLFVAFTARSVRINTRKLFWIATGSLAIYILIECALLFASANMAQGQISLMESLSGASNGFLIACMSLLFARLLCTLSANHAAALIPLSWAGSHLIFLSICFIPEIPVFPLEATLFLVSSGILFFLFKQLVASEFKPSTVVRRKKKIALAPLLQMNTYFSLYFGMLVFPFFYAFMAQFCGDANINSGLFDISTEIVGIVFLLLLAVHGYWSSIHLDAESLFVAVLPVFATALLLFPLFWGSEIFIAGYVMKCGFLVYSALVWINLQKISSKAPDKSFFYFGIGVGLYHLALLVGRLCASAVSMYTELSGRVVATIAIIAFWLLTMAALTMLYMQRRKKGGTQTQGTESDFDASFELFVISYHLSEREKAVLNEFARGRTVRYIAQDLLLSQETVRTHLKRAYVKTSCHNRQDVISRIESLGKETRGK